MKLKKIKNIKIKRNDRIAIIYLDIANRNAISTKF